MQNSQDTTAKRRKTIHSNLFNTAVLLFFTAYAWMEHNTFLIVLNMVHCVPVLPLTIFVLYIELHAKPEESVIEIVPEGLRFLLAGASPITVRSEDLRELVLMPSAAGQTLMIVLEDEDAFRSRQSPVERFYMTMSRLYCGHGIGLTPNLSLEDFQIFVQALDRTFPNCIATRQKAHRPPLLARLLGNAKEHEAPLPVHVPPPLSKA